MAKPERKSAGWMITFADLMALLLTFFIMLFSLSTVDSGKYEAMAISLKNAFGFHAMPWPGERRGEGRAGTPIGLPGGPEQPQRRADGGTGPREGGGAKPGTGQAIPVPKKPPPAEERTAEAARKAQEALKARLAALLKQHIKQGAASLVPQQGGLIVRFDEKITFATGSDRLVPSFRAVLTRIGPVIERTQGQIVVAGHTDDRPITNQRFRSNWDLSAARAVSVVHHLLDITKLRPDRIVAQGHGDTVPLFANDSEAHRAKNRRVEIRIVLTPASRPAK